MAICLPKVTHANCVAIEKIFNERNDREMKADLRDALQMITSSNMRL